jgi:3-isopropylmalate dehydrogenase
VSGATRHVVVLAGDGIGPEIMAPTVQLLGELGSFAFEERLVGGAAIDGEGAPVSDETVAACRRADAVLLGAAGGPRWDTDAPGAPRAEDGLQRLRKELDLFANLRPIRPHRALLDVSPLRPERLDGTDLLIVRETTSGLYFGARGWTGGRAFDTLEYTEDDVERVLRVAFRLARRKVTSVDKANVLETSRMWRHVAQRVHAAEFADVPLDHLLVDNAAMRLVARPGDFDVIVTENTFGDILSDEGAVLVGSIGLLPSATLGAEGAPGLFEPVHGSAPDIEGTGAANPLGMFLSAALMLRHGLGMEPEASALETAVSGAIDDGLRTADLGGPATTADATRMVLERL